jgi:uncharacterized damage-inducible protein DinB
MDRTLIETYAAGGAKLRKAVEGLTREDFLAKPGPGDWSIQELVIHLTDSEYIAIDRMKRMLAENGPALLYADETAYVQALHSDEQSIDDAVLLFDVGRRQFARVLRKLPDAAFERHGNHSRKGRVTVGEMVGSYIQHLDYHLGFLYEKRKRLGKPV